MSARFVAPTWLVLDEPRAATVRDLVSGDRVRFEGASAQDVVSGDVAALRSLARFAPTVQRFVADLERAPARPLTRDVVLRGGGWRHLFIELGARCNERCVHCYAESGPERDEEIATDVVLRVLDDAKAMGFRNVQLTGGDPLIAPSFLPAATHATRLGFESVEVYTNGLALRGALFDALLPLRPRFAFSFYSSDPVVHDGITQTPGSQARTAEAIRSVVAAGLPARVGIVVLEANLHDVERTVAFVQGLGIAPDRIAIDVQRGVGRGSFADRSTDWSLPKTAARGGHQDRSGAPIRFGGTACVAYDGNVYPCIFSRHLPLGDARAQGLRAVLEDPTPVLGALDIDPGTWSDRLTCLHCRVRSALLAGPPADGLVPLRMGREGARGEAA